MTQPTSGLTNDQSFDAQQIAESVESGEKKLPKVNVEADYQASKEFSVSEIDRTSAGAKAAEAATAPKFSVPTPQTTELTVEPSSNPDDFRAMAQEIHPDAGATGVVSDELVQKAIEKGTPA